MTLRHAADPTPEPTATGPWLSVVVPVFNEADNLEPLCAEIHAALDPAGIDFELVIADDGSSDATPQVLERLAARDPRVRVVTLRQLLLHTAGIPDYWRLAVAAGGDSPQGAERAPQRAPSPRTRNKPPDYCVNPGLTRSAMLR